MINLPFRKASGACLSHHGLAAHSDLRSLARWFMPADLGVDVPVFNRVGGHPPRATPWPLMPAYLNMVWSGVLAAAFRAVPPVPSRKVYFEK